MKERQSILTRRMVLLVEAMETMYQAIKPVGEIPFGMEELTPEQVRRRIQAMTETQRTEFVGRMGPEGMRELLRLMNPPERGE